MTKSDLHHILNALEAAEVEFEQLIFDKEWYVSEVVELIASAKELVASHIKETK
jgi:hypothetical protein